MPDGCHVQNAPLSSPRGRLVETVEPGSAKARQPADYMVVIVDRATRLAEVDHAVAEVLELIANGAHGPLEDRLRACATSLLEAQILIWSPPPST